MDAASGSPLPGLTVVSVFHEPELLMQRIQARSLDHYLAGPAADVVLLDNTRRGLDRAEREDLVAAHGRLATRVRILRPGQVCSMPRALGWRTQQVLKLAVAELVRSPHYVVLDAKNHLVAPADLDTFVDAAGRPRVPVHGYRGHPLRPSLERVLTYVGLDPTEHVDHFTETATPFTFHTALARRVVRGVAERAGRPFADEFVREALTEFFLYSAWSLAHGVPWDDLVEPVDPLGVTVWPKAGDTRGVHAALAELETTGAPFFAVHRRALLTMDPIALQVLGDFWVDRGLLPAATGADQVTSMARSVSEAHQSARVRQLPLKARAAVHRARREMSRWRGRPTGATAHPVRRPSAR